MTTVLTFANPFQSLVELTGFIDDFESGQLPREQWTHQAHLVVALWYLVNFSRDEAVNNIRNGILSYNRSCGIQNTAHSGYHETLTLFWIRTVETFLSEKYDVPAIPDLVAELLNSPYADRNLPLKYYSKSHLMSTEARMQWQEPDLNSE